MGKNSKDLSTEVEKTLPAVPEKFDEVFSVEENMADVEHQFPVIGIVHQAQLFSLPDGSTVKSFEGIILDTNRINAWWEKSFDETGGGTPPDCFSLDSMECNQNSNMPQSPRCGTEKYPECDKNKYGSDGRGKACKNMRRMHIVIAGELLPHRMTLPPSSLKAMAKYISGLSSKGLQYQRTKTVFELKEEKNQDGVKYSEIKPKRGELVTDLDQLENLMKLYGDLKPEMREQRIKFEEYDKAAG